MRLNSRVSQQCEIRTHTRERLSERILPRSRRSYELAIRRGQTKHESYTNTQTADTPEDAGATGEGSDRKSFR